MSAHAAGRRAVAALAAAELPVVLLISPALLFPTPARLALALLVPVTWVCHRHLGGRPIPATPLNLPILGLLAMAGVSLFATFDITFSLGKVSGLLLGTLLFWAGARWTNTAGRLSVATLAFVLAGTGLAVVGLFGINWIDKFPVMESIVARIPKAIRGVPGAEDGFQPNAVAGCLVLFIPLQIALVLTPSHIAWMAASRARTMIAIEVCLLLLTLGTAVLTQSRGAWAGLLLAAIAFLAWHSGRTRTIAALGVGLLVVNALALGPRRVIDLAISQSGPGMAGNVSGRVELWSSALDGIQDFRFTGMGMNTFRRVLPVLYPTVLTSPDFDVAHAHNHLLQAALDLGVPGLIAYAALWLGAGALLVCVYRTSRDRTERAVAGGLGAGLIAHFAFSMTDAIPLGSKVGVLFWLTLTLVAALHQVAMDRAATRAPGYCGEVRG